MFGHGNGTYHADSTAYAVNGVDGTPGARVRAYFDNGMVAHVWAQCSQSFGRSHNGNFFFHGRALFSYGSHYCAGYILPGERVALLNGDSYSISTSRHVGEAWGATRHMTRHSVPDLTALARVFEAGLSMATGPTPGAFSLPEFARYVGPRLRKAWEEPDKFPGFEAARDIFEACGLDNPARRARAAEAAHARAVAKRDAKRAKSRKAEALHKAKLIAESTLATVPGAIPADMESHARRVIGSSEHAVKEWEERGREAFRAAKAAKAEGWTRIAATCRAVHKAIRAELWRFEAAELRRNRLSVWRRNRRKFQKGLGALEAAREAMPTAERSLSDLAHALRDAAGAASDLAGYLGQPFEENRPEYSRGDGMAVPAARVAGVRPMETGARLSRVCATFREHAARLDAARERIAKRGEVAALKRARDLATDPGDSDLATLQRVFEAASRVAWRYGTGPNFSPRPLHPVPGAWALAGWTPDKFATVRDDCQERAKAAKSELERVAREEREEAERQALALWRAGERIPAELAKFKPYARPDGSAYVRALDVTRDASGAITGGTLETSQGASVPLPHALRVFAFLKACRDAGKAWHANGRTLRVGHFTVDRVDSSGGFKAGCHVFAFEECAALAESLGVAGIAPADTTESRAHA